MVFFITLMPIRTSTKCRTNKSKSCWDCLDFAPTHACPSFLSWWSYSRCMLSFLHCHLSIRCYILFHRLLNALALLTSCPLTMINYLHNPSSAFSSIFIIFKKLTVVVVFILMWHFLSFLTSFPLHHLFPNWLYSVSPFPTPLSFQTLMDGIIIIRDDYIWDCKIERSSSPLTNLLGVIFVRWIYTIYSN